MKKYPLIPRIKSLKRVLSFVHSPIPVMYQYIQEYGDTFHMYLGGVKKGLVTSDPKIIRQVMQKNHKNYEKSELQTKMLAQYIGKGLLTSEGDYWFRQRRLIQPGFHKYRIRNLVSLIQDVVDTHLEELEDSRGKAINMYPKMMEIAFRVIGNALFSTAANDKELATIESSIFQVQQFIIKRVRQPFMQPWYWLKGDMKKYKDIALDIEEVILKIIRSRKELKEQPDDLLGMLINTRYEDTGEAMSEEQLLWESNILFVAGHETSANALSWMLYKLAKHKDVAQKLKKEMDVELGDGALSFEALMKMPYLNAVILETMRMYPPAWISDRISKGEDEINGHIIPANTLIILLLYHSHHREEDWVEPQKFNPDRFVGVKNPSAYFPFGAGPRMCIGNNFAMLEMQIFLVQFLRKFRVELDALTDDSIEALITLKPKNGITLQIH